MSKLWWVNKLVNLPRNVMFLYLSIGIFVYVVNLKRIKWKRRVKVNEYEQNMKENIKMEKVGDITIQKGT